MTFLPIVARELRVASRRPSTYWIRLSAAVSVLVVGAWCLGVKQGLPTLELSVVMFGAMTGITLLFAALSGVRYTADCISEEKRQGTLGLLFLTKLKGFDVVLGKLAASSLNTFYGVLAILPVLALPLLLGGRSPGEVGRMALVILNTLFFSLATGMAVSSICYSGRSARGFTLAVVFSLAALLPACGLWLVSQGRLENSWALAFYLPSPFFAFSYGFDSKYRGPGAELFWWSLVLTHCLGWLGLGVAAWRTPRAWQQKPAGTILGRLQDRWRHWTYGKREARIALRRDLLQINPFFWLAARVRLKPFLVWVGLGLTGILWCCGWLKYGKDWFAEPLFLVTAGFLSLLIKSWFASEAAQQFGEARQNQNLELLLSTPLSVREILEGQRLALQRQFLGPVVAISCVFLLFLLVCLGRAEMADERKLWVFFWGETILLLMADLAALFWFVIWRGLTAAHPNRAAGDALALVLLIPALCIAVMVLAFAAWGQGGSSFEPTGRFMLTTWFLLGMATDLGLGGLARYKLLKNFRAAAAERYVAPISIWKRWFAGSSPPSPS